MTDTASNVLPLPRPAPARSQLRTVTLLTLSGAPFCSAGFLPGDPGAPWAWMCEVVAAEWGCGEEQVGASEGNDGEDFVTVDGVPVARVGLERAASRERVAPAPVT